ncbi:MAG: M28 family metallopeptidase [Trueperaceae bacterium]|nr:M28 family metallopeptidase [Trueperaceae bacterium]
MRIRPIATALALLLVLAACSTTDTALEAPAELGTSGAAACSRRPNMTHAMLQECVTLDGVRAHQAAFQAIADANGGTRVSGTAGYDQSVDYVVETLEAVGYDVTVQPFDFQTFITLSPTVLEQVAPPPAGSIPTSIFSYSGSGDVTAPVTALPAPPADATPGCDAADFAGFPAGHIALISRGACTFAIKATNAYDAGASAVVIYNNVSGELNGTLGNAFTLDIAVTSVTQAVGQQFAATPGLVLRVKTDTFRGVATSYNVLAETRWGDPSNVVMVGAHLDSVNDGPGIQDNGSGSAAILETAVQMAQTRVRNQVRFAWWGAEESGLVGSTYYVNQLARDEVDAIALYLNFDMIGSPNFVRFVYDGDDSDGVGAGPGPAGSAQIEATFARFYDARGLAYQGTDFSGRSDYGPFIAMGIPAGGLFTGAEGIKTPDEAAIYGGTAGDPYDPCYHLACDTFDNISLEVLDQNADAVAYATLQYGMNTSDVNGVRGQGNFRLNPGPGPDPEAAQTE